mgnify:CR=1 FL=1
MNLFKKGLYGVAFIAVAFSSIQCKTDKKKEKAAKGTKIEPLGMTLVPLSDALRTEHNLSKDVQGLLITEVDPTSNAAEKGVRPGDILVEFDQENVKTAKDVEKLAKQVKEDKRTSVLLRLERNGTTHFTAIQIKTDDKK